MPKGRGKEYQKEDEAYFEPIEEDEEMIAEEDTGYIAGPEEREKIEEVIARHEPVPMEPVEEPEPEPKPPEPSRRLGTGEPIYLYIRTGVGTYTVVDQPFESHIEARQFAEENYKGTKYKTMSDADITEYLEKLEQRQQKIERAKEKVAAGARVAKREIVTGARVAGVGLKAFAREEVRPRIKRYARAGLEASYDVAAAQRMTREQMQPEIRQAWGVQPRPPVRQPPPAPIARAPPPAPEQRPPTKPSIRQAYQPPRAPYQPPSRAQQPRRRIFIPTGGGVFGPSRPRGPPREQERRSRIFIPPGGGVFGPSRRVKPESPEAPYQKRPIKTAPAFARTPIKSTQPPRAPGINVGGLHMARPHFVGRNGVNIGRRPPPPTETPIKKKKHKKKSNKKRR